MANLLTKGHKLVVVYTTSSFSRVEKPSGLLCFVCHLYGVSVPCASHMGFCGWGYCMEKRQEPKSLGSTPVVVASEPCTAREILTSPHFADRPIKQSAKSLMFSRAIGLAPNGTYWRLLRRIASSHLFAPRRVTAHEASRQLECAGMLRNIATEQQLNGRVSLRKHLQAASLNNTMGSVLGP